MPKRIIDGEAMWSSTRLSRCPEWVRPEFAWLLPLADPNGSFEITNLRVIWGKVAAIRENLTLDQLTEAIQIFRKHGLLFTWTQDGKVFAHWTNSDKRGRLPRPSRRNYERILAPAVPEGHLAEYIRETDAKSVGSPTPQASLGWSGFVSVLEGKGAAANAAAVPPAAAAPTTPASVGHRNGGRKRANPGRAINNKKGGLTYAEQRTRHNLQVAGFKITESTD